MANNKLAKGIERIVTVSARGLGEVQINIDKVLWGNPSPPRDRRSSASYGSKPAKEPVNYTTKTVPIQRTPTPTAAQLTAGTNPAATLQSRISSAPTLANTDIRSRISSAPSLPPQKELTYKEVKTKPEKPKPGQKLIETGLFSALDALNSVDLCNVVTYAFDNINSKRQPRPERGQWTATQTAFYTLQDQAGLVVKFIDKYTAYPNVLIGSYLGVGPNAVPPQQAVSQSNAPVQGGVDVQKYNMYYLLKGIGEAFSFNTNSTGSLFTSQDALLLQEVPGLGSNLNFVNDFLGNVNKYADYRQIQTPELLALQNKIANLKYICQTIQNLNFKSAVALAGNFLGVDIRSQVQKLNEFININEISRELKKINDAIRSFINMANQVQKVIQTGQFIIKAAILLIKVFKFIFNFFKSLVIPLIFGTAGTQITLQDVVNKAKDESDGLVRVLKSINALLGVATNFIRYLVVNATELLRRLDTLLLNLQACDAFKDSDLLSELQQTRESLNTLLDDLALYVINYDSKTDPDTALFGAYQIRIIDEEVVDLTVANKRRRGVALDQNGSIVTQSDLTFATNPEVIIGEVKQKLVALGLVRPDLGAIDSDSLAVISESLNYLDNNDILENDLNIDPSQLDSPDNSDENKGIGLNAFINNLKGGRRLRKRTRTALAKNRAQLNSQLTAQRTQGSQDFTNQASQRRTSALR